MNLWNVPVEMSFLKSRMNLKMRMNFDMVCKKASLLPNVNTLVGNDRTNSIFIYQTWIFCKKIGSNRSFLPEIGAQTFCYIPWRVTTAYSIDIANWVGQSTTCAPTLSLIPASHVTHVACHPCQHTKFTCLPYPARGSFWSNMVWFLSNVVLATTLSLMT